MFEISPNKIITVTRGDSFELPVSINAGTVLEPIEYELQDNDELFLAICEPYQPFERALIKKSLTKFDNDGVPVFIFQPKDTEFLLPGVYYYEVKLRTLYHDEFGEVIKEDVSTVISKRKFIILN